MVGILYFNGANKKHTYFEGWYFKHSSAQGTTSAGGTLAFIPGMNVDEGGNKQAFLQIITPTTSYVIDYPYSEFYAASDKLEVLIGNNYFSSEGAVLDIQTDALSICGTIAYKDFTPLASSIMGPFSLIPLMQCNHGIMSLHHTLRGELLVNGTQISFDGGTGYSEKDWGSSFPTSYVWTQANDFDNRPCNEKISVMLSVAHIPFGLLSFRGCLCSILFNGIQFCLATYKGVRVLACEPDRIILKQGAYLLEVFPNSASVKASAQILNAPKMGSMNRIIHESLRCTVRYRFSENGRILFDVVSSRASYEAADEAQPLEVQS